MLVIHDWLLESFETVEPGLSEEGLIKVPKKPILRAWSSTIKRHLHSYNEQYIFIYISNRELYTKHGHKSLFREPCFSKLSESILLTIFWKLRTSLRNTCSRVFY